MRDCCRRLERLLIGETWRLALVAEGLGTDRPECAGRTPLQGDQPIQEAQAGLQIGRDGERCSRHDQGLAEPRIVVGQSILEPDPILGFDGLNQSEQPVGQHASNVAGPIEIAFPKLKALLRKASELTVDGLWRAIGRVINPFDPAGSSTPESDKDIGCRNKNLLRHAEHD